MGFWAAMVLITFLICVTVVLIILGDGMIESRKQRKLPKVDPEHLLAERYAKGEINEAEYAQRLSVLRMGPPLELFFDK